MSNDTIEQVISTGDEKLLKKLLRDKSPAGAAVLGGVLARSTDHPTRFSVVESLAKRKDDRAALDALVAAARTMANADDGDNIPSMTITAIAKNKTGGLDAVLDLAPLSPRFERNVVDTVSRIVERDKVARAHPRVQALFSASLSGPNGAERGTKYAAVMGLSFAGNEAALDALIPLLDDDNVDVRIAAAQGVAKAGGPRALAALKDRATRADQAELDWQLRKLIQRLESA